MKTRLFKSDELTQSSSIIAVPSEDIVQLFSTYGAYTEGYEWKLSDLTHENGVYFAPANDFASSEIDSFFQEKHELEEDEDGDWPMDEAQAKEYCYLKSFNYEGEGEYVSGNETGYFLFGKGVMEALNFSDTEPEGEAVTEWDGNNMRTTYYTSEHGYCPFEEVTDQYPNWDSMIELGRKNGKGGHTEYHLMDEKIVVANVSYFQGSGTTYEVFGLDDEGYHLAILNLPEDVSAQYFPNWGEKLTEYVAEDLSFTVEDGLPVAHHRGESYHLTFSEAQMLISQEIEPGTYLSIEDHIREQIATRKEERLAEYYQQHLDNIPLELVFVSLEDSLKAGNCEEHSNQFAQYMRGKLQATGEIAVRADIILKERDDSYSRRAVVKAFLSHYAQQA